MVIVSVILSVMFLALTVVAVRFGQDYLIERQRKQEVVALDQWESMLNKRA